ncbi:Heavy metal transport/detoxification superfamily protein [Abeliophyllum distichum]|uniref:Heavy metal transport/detoxification superfamily protein n=1 Tax=Abeliophyllum distichum TaxID=126358 RepID=A0ABD1SCH3_9LAMI
MHICCLNVFDDQQKVVIEVSLNGHNSQGIIEMLKCMCCMSQELNQAAKVRIKAMKMAVSVPRVESAAMEGKERNKLTVIGEEIDSVTLVKLLRKNVCFAKIVTVGPMKKDEKKTTDMHHMYYNHVPHWGPYYTTSNY